MRKSPTLAVLAAAAVLLTGCQAGREAAGSPGADVKDGTFTISLPAAPGNLDPHQNATYVPAFLTSLAYESLVFVGGDSVIRPRLAESWTQTPTSVTYKLRSGVTCADGTPLTAKDVAANYAYVADPKNKSPLLGGGLPTGTKAVADPAAGTVTLTTPAPNSFLVQATGSIGIVCPAGLADRSRLTHGTLGTGLFQLSTAVDNDNYTFTRRQGYTWGHDGTTSDTPGVPKTVVVKIIPNQTTVANLLLSGQLTAGPATGPDRTRLEAAGFTAVPSRGPTVQMWFNHAPGRVTSDERVRRAVAMAFDVPRIAKVAGGGWGLAPKRLTAAEPPACPQDTVTGNTPAFDVAGANALLDEAGWRKGPDGIRVKDGRKLTLSLIWGRDLGDPTAVSAAADLTAGDLKAIGAEVVPRGVTDVATGEILFGTSDYDISWIPIFVSLPTRFLGFVSGPKPPNGTNFPNTDLSEVPALAKKANGLTGAESCETWNEIERLYLRSTAVVPVLDSDNAVLTRGATFELSNLRIVPTTIRITG
ncbi:ABC transporter substrate-binding protein [Rhizohabitans arisaemae]|uniref:ABC transporter substrate-binding protein n=1 Tax=Rhizohabitans arisaemae TaxID=2720610 RepID=UPI0024B0988B|nr:ABC transporter substrate-binding protein [Rhizohabitans arisaemae]